MKNFNFNLGSVKETLTREQMKQISGGVDTACFYGVDMTNDVCSRTPVIAMLGWYVSTCDDSISGDMCQQFEDALCESDECCTGVNCYY